MMSQQNAVSKQSDLAGAAGASGPCTSCRLIRLLSTSIGRKAVMAISGAGLLSFLFFHMLGNLQVFQGPEKLNAYAAWIQSFPLLWPARIGLLAIFGIHMYLSIRLARENSVARPVAYHAPSPMSRLKPSRYMLLSGLVVIAFVVYHLLHLTFGVIASDNHGMVDSQGRHDVYQMVVLGFQHPCIAASYIVALLLLCVHLLHGAQSVFQTIGLNHQSYNLLIRVVTYAFVIILTVGNLAMPLAVQFGIIKLTGVP